MMTTIDQPMTRREFREDILPHLATKADLKDLEIRLTRWMIGVLIGSATIATSLAVFIQRIIG